MTRLMKPFIHLWCPFLILAIQPLVNLSPVPAGMHSPVARSDLIPIRQLHARAARLKGGVSGAENTLAQVVKAVLRMVRPVVPVDKDRAYMVKTVHLVPHGHTKRIVLLTKKNKALAARANRVPLYRGRVAFHRVVRWVVVEGGLNGANLKRKLARPVTGEVGCDTCASQL